MRQTTCFKHFSQSTVIIATVLLPFCVYKSLVDFHSSPAMTMINLSYEYLGEEERFHYCFLVILDKIVFKI